MVAIHLPEGKSVNLVPEYSVDYTMWCGESPSLEEYKKGTGADEVFVICLNY